MRSPDKKLTSAANASLRPTGDAQFWTVTGSDFGRSIKWSRQQPNAALQQIRTAISSSSRKTR